jgi:CBS domain-containing protein
MILIEHILDDARKRLAMLSCEAAVHEAAEILMNPDTPLIVVCDDQGLAVGVISRTNVVKVLADAQAEALSANADTIMTRDVLSFRMHQSLQQVWDVMNARSLRSAPILDDDGRPRGIVHARDIATALLDEVTNEEILLRDYVLGVGYQ